MEIKNTKIKIEKLKKQDIKKAAKIASENFSGLKDIKNAEKWILGNFLNYPRFQYFTAKIKSEIIGYILWQEKGGFRSDSVWEIEQIAVSDKFKNQGIGTALINKSFAEIKKYVKKQNRKIKVIAITTGTKNKAKKLYKKTLGAKTEAVIKNFFRENEAIMIVRFK